MTQSSENIYTPTEFQQFLSKMNHIRILEEEIDVEIQQEFMELSKTLEASKIADDEAIILGSCLFDTATTDQQVKNTLVILAFRGSIEAFRMIENYCKIVPIDLQGFAHFAYHISQVFVESELTEEMPSFVSSGLGGKGSLLRYCIVIFPSEDEGFTETQQKILEIEFREAVEKISGEMEQTRFLYEYAFFKMLVPLSCDLNIYIKNCISESNKYGNFVYEGYFATNVKTPGHSEILKVISDLKSQYTGD